MRINLSSIMVDDQAKALKFYTEVLGFVKKADIPMGEYRWLTVISPESGDDIELVLEPMGFPPSKVYQKALYDAGIPVTMFFTDDIKGEYAALKDKGVAFRGEPQFLGPVTMVIFEDTCGNLVQLAQMEKA
jgi:catechol 2,3-dioxygenase-like lactoylglutathione lyase family enzyme